MATLKTPDWTSDDSNRLRDFLATETGQRTLANLVHLRPSFSAPSAPAHEAAAIANRIAGYEDALRELVDLTLPPPDVQELLSQNAPSTDNYPPLEDDTLWPEQHTL